MAKSIDITSRIDGLKRALDRAKTLPKQTIFDAKPMAELAGVTWVCLRDWCNNFPEFDGTDCFTRGGQGIAWAFKPAQTIEILVAHFEADRQRRQTRNRDVAQQVGLDQHGEAPADLNELSKQVSLTLQLTEAKEKQRGNVPAARVSEFLAGYNTAAVEAVLGVKAQVDSTGALPPEIGALMDEHLRNVAAAMSRRVSVFIKDYNAGSVQIGDSRNS